ncbi:PEP/pyruvate-binding domain-containing protein [Amycolatopsis nigrescens]|uniref:PEP/pyruvate-binding domain-containing protein n=1 Tax=Amycolatopsis nigrescens TaxID=381445 RepID=UPI00035F09C3|nr:PEP/pyruvate-binding domain-containing protein [Amycolatopsis nigrescens]
MNQIAGAEIVSLDDEAAADTARAGAKAAVLARMRRAGFRVPDGVVVLADVLRAQLGSSAPSAEELLAAPLAPELRQAIVAAGRTLTGPLAVRSSGIDEDGAQASHAGQYDTVLDVDGDDELVDAVRTCWASGLSATVRSYRNSVGREGDSPLAVLVQDMVRADAAGVAFTANPVTGARDEILVSAVPGLGEKLVSGEVTPDEWVVRGERADNTADHHGALSAEQVKEIAALAERVAEEFGGPSDLEWAVAGDELFLLQVRPITALADPEPEPVPILIDPPEGFWVKESTHAPAPLLPMTQEFVQDNNDALLNSYTEFGLLAGMRLKIIGGWHYQSMVPAGPSAPSQIERCITASRTDHLGTVLSDWYDEQRDSFLRRIERLRSADLPALSTEDLVGQLTDARELHRDAAIVHFRLVGAVVIALGELAVLLTEELKWPNEQVFELFAGLSPESTNPANQLRGLVEIAEKRLDGAYDLTSVRALLETDAEFAATMETYQREYGSRALHYELATPALGERPDLILSLVRDQLARGAAPEVSPAEVADQATIREAAAARARAAIEDSAELQRFEHLLARAQKAYPVREDNEYATVSAPYALLRWAALEAGRRLVDLGRLDKPEHVFFAEVKEVLAALTRETDLRGIVERRRGEHRWALQNPGPASYGVPPGPPPAMDGLPVEVRSVVSALRWSMLNAVGAPVADNEAGQSTVRGLPGSAGSYTGTVRVVLDEHEFHKIQVGDVLVCPSTSPVWSVVFPNIGALVTDTGGALSHAAIIAREYGIPATLATGNGTETLVDGSTVTVDGTAGTVEIHSVG